MAISDTTQTMGGGKPDGAEIKSEHCGYILYITPKLYLLGLTAGIALKQRLRKRLDRGFHPSTPEAESEEALRPTSNARGDWLIQ